MAKGAQKASYLGAWRAGARARGRERGACARGARRAPRLFVARVPWAALTLLLASLAAYFLISEGALYADKEALARVSFSYSSPLTIVTHLFSHVGFLHLLSNLLPLMVFALICELALPPRRVLELWFFSGIVSALIFGLVTPSKALIGGSAAIAGLIGASLLVKPRHAMVALIAVPLLLFVAMPMALQALASEVEHMQQQQAALGKKVEKLLEANQTVEAAQVNETLVAVQKSVEKLTKGIAHEAATPTEIPVHVYGFVLGLFYVALFARREVAMGIDELIASLHWLRKHFG